MKFLCFFFLTTFLVACRPYVLVDTSTFPIPEKYTNADKASNRIVSVQQFPARIKRSGLFKFSDFTNDTAQAYHTNKKLSVFVDACYDKKMMCGYLISANRDDIGKTLIYTCILFEVTGAKLKASTYYLGSAVTGFPEAKPYLIPENERLFGGRIATKKEMRKNSRKLKRTVKKK